VSVKRTYIIRSANSGRLTPYSTLAGSWSRGIGNTDVTSLNIVCCAWLIVWTNR